MERRSGSAAPALGPTVAPTFASTPAAIPGRANSAAAPKGGDVGDWGRMSGPQPVIMAAGAQSPSPVIAINTRPSNTSQAPLPEVASSLASNYQGSTISEGFFSTSAPAAKDSMRQHRRAMLLKKNEQKALEQEQQQQQPQHQPVSFANTSLQPTAAQPQPVPAQSLQTPPQTQPQTPTPAQPQTLPHPAQLQPRPSQPLLPTSQQQPPRQEKPVVEPSNTPQTATITPPGEAPKAEPPVAIEPAPKTASAPVSQVSAAPPRGATASPSANGTATPPPRSESPARATATPPPQASPVAAEPNKNLNGSTLHDRSATPPRAKPDVTDSKDKKPEAPRSTTPTQKVPPKTRVQDISSPGIVAAHNNVPTIPVIVAPPAEPTSEELERARQRRPPSYIEQVISVEAFKSILVEVEADPDLEFKLKLGPTHSMAFSKGEWRLASNTKVSELPPPGEQTTATWKLHPCLLAQYRPETGEWLVANDTPPNPNDRPKWNLEEVVDRLEARSILTQLQKGTRLECDCFFSMLTSCFCVKECC